MKVLSDFDGVMTNQVEEALYQRHVFREKIVSTCGVEAMVVEAWWADAMVALRGQPSRYGWWSEGRLAVYADEDLFMETIGLAGCLDEWADGDHVELAGVRARLADEEGIESFVGLGRWAMQELVRHTREGAIRPMDPVVGDTIRRLLDADVDVVVVSNSSTERVVELLCSVDLEAVVHEDDPSARLRVRGGARKFDLGETREEFELGGRVFDANRPRYRTIVDEERPHVVIGDVFSLDLAAPLYLSRTAPEMHGGVTLLLREQPYTPQWARDIIRQDSELHARLGFLSSFGEVQRVVPGLLPPVCGR